MMENAVRSKEVKVLWHFTRCENLGSILADGLKSRGQLEDIGGEVTFNDAHRYDNQRDAICASITFPNYRMFYPLRMDNPDVEWVVLGLRPSILWMNDCAFCVENAASDNVRHIQIEQRKTVDAFLEMFEPFAGKPSRSDMNLKKCVPTNPEAEVLMFDPVEPIDIIGVACETTRLRDNLKRIHPGTQIVKKSKLFS